jgi:hypothetical protein
MKTIKNELEQSKTQNAYEVNFAAQNLADAYEVSFACAKLLGGNACLPRNVTYA